MGDAQRRALKNGRVRCHEYGFTQTRFSFCRLDDLLCVHAGGRNGKRPRDHLFSLQGSIAWNDYFALIASFDREQGSSALTRYATLASARAPCYFELGLASGLTSGLTSSGLASVFGAMDSSSTSKIRVEFGPISCPAPRSPYARSGGTNSCHFDPTGINCSASLQPLITSPT